MKLGAEALAGVPFSKAQLDALYRAIQVNDVIDEDAQLPSAATSHCTQNQLIDGFRISRQLWREGFDPDVLIALVQKVGSGVEFGEHDRMAFKHIRAKFKHLRFAFVLYCDDHRCPTVFKALTTSMGHLQDAFKGADLRAVQRNAAVSKFLLTSLPQLILNREVDRLTPCEPDAYRRFVSEQMAALRFMLEKDTLTGHQFHAARKIVSRQVSFHDDMRTISPSPEGAAMSRYLGTINGLMGQYHDGLVLKRATGELNYARTGFELPAGIRQRLETLVNFYS